MKPFTADADLLKALPGRLRQPMDDLKLRGGAELTVKHLVVLTPPERPAAGDPPPPALLPIAPGSSPKAARGQSAASAADEPDPVVFWDAELRLLGASLEVGLPWDEVVGAVAVRGRYEGTHLGAVRGNLWLDQASIARQPVTEAKVSFRSPAQAPDPQHAGKYQPPFFEFQDFSGTLFHGSIGGEARVVLAEPTRYEIWLTATDVRLDEVARHYKLGSDADLKGVAQAQVWFANRPDPRTGLYALEGTGKVDVPTGPHVQPAGPARPGEGAQAPGPGQDGVRGGPRRLPLPGRPGEGGPARPDRRGRVPGRVRGAGHPRRLRPVRVLHHLVPAAEAVADDPGGRPDARSSAGTCSRSR